MGSIQTSSFHLIFWWTYCPAFFSHWCVSFPFFPIGFGDFVPAQGVKNDSEISIALCSLYLLFGIALLAMSFNLVQEEVISNVKSVARRLGILKEEEVDDWKRNFFGVISFLVWAKAKPLGLSYRWREKQHRKLYFYLSYSEAFVCSIFVSIMPFSIPFIKITFFLLGIDKKKCRMNIDLGIQFYETEHLRYFYWLLTDLNFCFTW